MALDHGSEPISFSGHTRQIVGEFFKIKLFLISQFEHRFVGLGI